VPGSLVVFSFAALFHQVFSIAESVCVPVHGFVLRQGLVASDVVMYLVTPLNMYKL
jgi:uncharacterized membrane protein